jgi:hypothetical protein
MEWIYMRHPETGGVAQFPAGVEEGWNARGWERCEAPPEDDILGDTPPIDPTPEPAPPVSQPAKSTAKDKKENADG